MAQTIMSVDLPSLAQLKDIHQPTAVAWWPLAPAWYFVFLGLMLIGIYLGFYFYKKLYLWQRKKALLQKLALLKQRHLDKPQDPLPLQEANILLKQILFSYYPRMQIASLYGADWLKFLDEISQETQYSEGTGIALSDAQYQAQISIEPGVFDLIEQTVKRTLSC